VIITDEKLLRVKCEEVLPDEIDSLREELEKELKFSGELGRPGIGLAAPQIGISKNFAIIRINTQNGINYNVDLVNCRISDKHDEFLFKNEGCLSFPGEQVDTMRYKEIVVVDNMVKPHSFIATGILAVCIQHELDHLQGVLLPDLKVNR